MGIVFCLLTVYDLKYRKLSGCPDILSEAGFCGVVAPGADFPEKKFSKLLALA